MKVLVTGGSSRIGGYVLRDLQQHGYAVATYGRSSPLVEGIRHTTGDLGDLNALQGAMCGQEAIVHLAAVSHPRRAEPEQLMQTNVLGTFNVLEAAVRAGVGKVVFASTDATYGFAFSRQPRSPLYLPVDETHPCSPEDEYGLSKVIGEMMCRRYADAYGLRTLCVRINSAWSLDRAGAEVWVRSGAARVAALTCEGLWGLYRQQLESPEGPFGVTGPPPPRMRLFGYTDARDTAEAIRLAVENVGVQHGVFLTQADDACALDETDALLARYFPSVPQRAPLPGHASLFSHERATQLLGWRPRHSWRDSEFAAWLGR